MTKWYEERKAKGLCVKCGEPNDRTGKTMCTECAKKRSAESLETNHYFKKIGYCVECHREKVYGNRDRCVECTAKCAERHRKWRENMNADKSAEYHARVSERMRNTRIKRKENGLCERCGRPKSDDGYVNCPRCRAKQKEGKLLNDYCDSVMQRRIKAGLCCRCDEPSVEGYKMCKKHLEGQLKMIEIRDENKRKRKQELLVSQEN